MSEVSNSRVAIVGGSIAGCAAYIALMRANVDINVTIFERSTNLRDRGLGIGLPQPILDELLKDGYIGNDYRFVRSTNRQWFVRDSDAPRDSQQAYMGRKVWEQKLPVLLNNWGLLWQQLRQRVPDTDYHSGVKISNITYSTSGVELFDDDNASVGTFDVVIAANGYNSSIRRRVVGDDAANAPRYSGYVLWRGSAPYKDRIKDVVPNAEYFITEECLCTTCYEGGHGIFYLIPNSRDPEDYTLNWGLYLPTPPGINVESPSSIWSDAIPDVAMDFFHAIVQRELPPFFQKLVAHSDSRDMSIHPIYDDNPPHYTDEVGQSVLIGDAGAILRPHTASGTSKALSEARLLGSLAASSSSSSQANDTWLKVFAKYEEERKVVSADLVELGYRLGTAQVVETPSWATMTVDEYEAWSKDIVAGGALYLYQKSEG